MQTNQVRPEKHWPEQLWRNCFWLLVPILLVNVAFGHRLPAAFQPEVFWKDIPLFVAIPENVFRGLVMVVPFLMPLRITSSTQRRGVSLFVLGTLVYFASWAALILAPESRWSQSAFGFMAPALTPALWLTGLTLIGDHLVFTRFAYRRWMYAAIVVLFLVFHNAHAALVYLRHSA